MHELERIDGVAMKFKWILVPFSLQMKFIDQLHSIYIEIEIYHSLQGS